jgi:predicted NAD-dependent protein-ADP-ribosyltransferase YbiA (DUF1768 family)
LRKLLIETGDALIVEASPTDGFWGAGADGKGQNLMGQLVSQLREKRLEKFLQRFF